MTTTIIITSIASILTFSLIILILANIDEDLGLKVACTIWFPIIFVVCKILHRILLVICKRTMNGYAFCYKRKNSDKFEYIRIFYATPKMVERFKMSTTDNVLDGESIILHRKGKDFKSMPYKEDILTKKRLKEEWWNGIRFEDFLK